ncbi:hypothetical protein [Clostridium fungisolvens]|uniref:Uncharacterized protein n=1 Tax=Clostridium fungisolvens TaxID=1604897 RepID=A0A6V8SGP3_9CLOT|nr:hypothetical protein [Clostridium fungisolvens]GFP75752.1 hypothetical protein bsdtw1_01844 [Clostridium fungisolvens]
MEKLIKLIIYSVIAVCILYVSFNIIFFIGMVNSNARKEVDKKFISECKDDLKAMDKNFNLSSLEIYYQQGKYKFTIGYKKDLSEEDSKVIVKHMKELLLKDSVNKYLENKYSAANIYLTIECSNKTYYYKCPYYLSSASNNSNEKKNYKLWYFTKGTEEIISSIEVD